MDVNFFIKYGRKRRPFRGGFTLNLFKNKADFPCFVEQNMV